MKIDLYGLDGEKQNTEVILEDKIFSLPVNNSILSRYIRVYQANQRQGTAATKTRGEVSGGGRKPWAQKGTGRARQGSTRSPVWVGGGITHGPQPKSWRLILSRKMRQCALRAALSDKAQTGRLRILERLVLEEQKTGKLKKIISGLKMAPKYLIILGPGEQMIQTAGRNLAGVTLRNFSQVNAYDVLAAKSLILSKEALTSLENSLVKGVINE
mgnify:FL=1